MKKSVETIRGDSEGIAYEMPVYRISGSSTEAPSAYIQAALHGDELPGVVAIDALMPKLRRAAVEGRIRGNLTLVPRANPIGANQLLFHAAQGRFDLGTRTNYNRDFPLLDRPDVSLLPGDDVAMSADKRLKARLLKLSVGHDIVLDLHCDDEGVAYLYVPEELWPAMEDCAANMGVDAVILWGGQSGSSFDEASLHPYLKMPRRQARLESRVVTTVEYRGTSDVHAGTAEYDAEGLYRLLVARGVIEDASIETRKAFDGVVAPIEHIEMVPAPCAGAILYDVKPGDRVKAGTRLATIVRAPGEDGGRVEVLAPQDGYILTRRSHRATRAGDDLVKLVGTRPSNDARSGALEA
ncbi:succinylglutamate desuccinylase/aspartoacylase family protein [Aminobacter niigataensis]|uniref:succinylglutamate desuccinylase/aspartoacylase family protein n=1 Tax=Aminobacter niigataensis TaxID=83265 RepID=UPI0024CD1344|nr:succinylglutamate desuccinylase/aspartoacylase family protein [Aminobacter niigataensis]CAI2933878.1 Succinylglutamate desuccinylase / Aspartoacylase family protein [Aminobacter niigataensis]